MIVRRCSVSIATLAMLLLAPGSATAQAPDSAAAAVRPFVPGGYDDKPYLEGFFGRIRVGGYLEANAGWKREDGATSELGVELKRWNVLLSTDIRDRVQIFSELEIEDGGEEVTLELAQLDLRIARAFSLRGGMLLLPLGRFNLAHDAPRNDLPSRPAEAEELLGVALSQPGLGAFGRFDRGGSRMTWELYGVTGYQHELLTNSPDGTRLPAGRRNAKDENASPAVVGRLEWSRASGHALGVSGYHGAYNVYRVDGLDVEPRRDVSVLVLDTEVAIGALAVSGEAAHVEIEVPGTLSGLFASRQGGFYLQARWPREGFRIERLAGTRVTAAARLDGVDFDRDLPGDSFRSLSVGLAIRPVPETVFQLAWTRGETRDRFDNLGRSAEIRLGVATYF